MKKIIDDLRVVYKCCKMYYEDELGQQEIADRLGISRATISKMLRVGKQSGIVNIQVISPENYTSSWLEERMEELFHLKEVIVVEDSSLITSDEFQGLFADEVIRLLNRYLKEGDVVGVSMGKSLHQICHCSSEAAAKVDCTFVPLIGGVGSGSKMTESINSNQIAADMAEMFGAEYVEFYSPAVFADKHVMDGFMKEEPIHKIFQYYRKMKTVLMGIGIPNRGGSTMVKAGYITTAQLSEYVEEGLAGDLSLRFFDEDGRTEKFEAFNRRVAGMPLEQLRRIENRIIVASRGPVQAKALYAAIKGGYTNVLVVEQKCAEQLIKWKEEEQ